MCDLFSSSVSPSGRYRRLRVFEPYNDDMCYHHHHGCRYNYSPPTYRRRCPVHDGYLYRPDVVNYELYAPPVQWTYRPAVRTDCSVPCCFGGSPAPTHRYVELQPHQIPRIRRAVGYKEPDYLPTYGLNPTYPPAGSMNAVRTPEELAPPPPPPKQETPNSYPTTKEEGAGWTVFHCNDEKGSHTMVCIGDTLVEIRPQTSVQIAETSRDDWFARATHSRATCLGDQNGHFGHCYLAYSREAPKTHALVGNHSIHVEAAVAMRFTKSSPGYPYERC